MENIKKVGFIFFGIGVSALGVQQIVNGEFLRVILPYFPHWIPFYNFWVYLFGVIFFASGIIIIAGRKTRQIALIMGTFVLLLFIIGHIPYTLITFGPFNLAAWINPLKALSISGSFFIAARALPKETTSLLGFPKLINSMDKISPLGRFFFGIMFVIFGYSHFVLTVFVASLVPSWLSWHLFWTYFAAVALIAAGIAIIINFKMRLAATLLGIMLFIWFLIVHIPRAIADPHSGNGNEWTSVFEALAFSGAAFILSTYHFKDPVPQPQQNIPAAE